MEARHIILGNGRSPQLSRVIGSLLRTHFGLDIVQEESTLLLTDHPSNPYPPATVSRIMSLIDSYNNLHTTKYVDGSHTPSRIKRYRP